MLLERRVDFESAYDDRSTIKEVIICKEGDERSRCLRWHSTKSKEKQNKEVLYFKQVKYPVWSTYLKIALRFDLINFFNKTNKIICDLLLRVFRIKKDFQH
jgi:hypothetical protein